MKPCKHCSAWAYQRIIFELNEAGARIDSESRIVVEDVDSNAVVKHPKRLVLDKPFFIIMKKKSSLNPYFVMYVRNAELMQAWKPDQDN